MGYKYQLKRKEKTAYNQMVHSFSQALGLKDLEDMDQSGMKGATKDSLRDAKKQIEKNAHHCAQAVVFYLMGLSVTSTITVGPDSSLDLDEAMTKANQKILILPEEIATILTDRMTDTAAEFG